MITREINSKRNDSKFSALSKRIMIFNNRIAFLILNDLKIEVRDSNQSINFQTVLNIIDKGF